MLPDRWRFLADRMDRGVIRQWFYPGTDISDWRTLRTTRIWEGQGLEDEAGRGYDGIDWYRIGAAVSATFRGRPVKHNFDGVFGRVNVWVNGRFRGYRPFDIPWWRNDCNRSFDIDVSDAIDPARINTIVVRVDNGNEWGGIIGAFSCGHRAGSEERRARSEGSDRSRSKGFDILSSPTQPGSSTSGIRHS